MIATSRPSAHRGTARGLGIFTIGCWVGVLSLGSIASARPLEVHDLVIRNARIVDGTGGRAYSGMIAIDGDKIAYVGASRPSRARLEIDAHGHVAAPGFINMLSQADNSLPLDGRGLSDLSQGVTLEVFGEASKGPINASMHKALAARLGEAKIDFDWTTFGEFMRGLARRGITPNIASFVGAGTIRTFVLGAADVQPTDSQLDDMRMQVRQAMQEGALGLTTALIYAPNAFAKTPELIAMAKESARCGGIYTAHMRSEGDRIEDGVEETIAIAKASGAPAEIYHLKLAGRDNWSKIDTVIGQIEAARAAGVRITADMYLYTAGATGLEASMPPWVQSGGLDAWVARLKDPFTRARVLAEMRTPHPANWENLFAAAGPEGIRLLAFNSASLQPLTGQTLAEVAKARKTSPADTAIDLLITDHSRVRSAYTLMSDVNLTRQLRLAWVSLASDEAADAPEGVFLRTSVHPRGYGNFARLFSKYVREEQVLSLEEAVRRVTSLPASNLQLAGRGRLKAGNFADVVVFDPTTIADHATFEQPRALATGVDLVLVNGQLAYREGEVLATHSGRFIAGRGLETARGGGCRADASAWSWNR